MAAPIGEQPRTLCRVDIKAQHELPQFIEIFSAMPVGVFLVLVQRHGRSSEVKTLTCHGHGLIGNLRLDLQNGRSSIDLHVGYRHDLPDSPGKWSDDGHLHLHGLENREPVAGRHQIAGLYCNRDDHRGGGRVYESTRISIDTTRHALHLEAVVQLLDYEDNTETTPENGESGLERI